MSAPWLRRRVAKGGDVAADQGRDLGVADVPEGPSFEREPGPVPTPGHAPAVIAPHGGPHEQERRRDPDVLRQRRARRGEVVPENRSASTRFGRTPHSRANTLCAP